MTVSGTTKAIYKAFLRITKKFEEWCSQFNDSPGGGKTQIPIRLIVPASQCGSLIGKWNSSKECRVILTKLFPVISSQAKEVPRSRRSAN